MSATLLQGREVAAAIGEAIGTRVEAITAAGEAPPSLRILLVGNDDASAVYAGGLQKAGVKLGMSVEIDTYDQNLTEEELSTAVATLNDEASVDGVIVAMPLPKHLSSSIVSSSLDARKDVDGITIANAGSLYLGNPVHVPSTAAAILELLKRNEIPLKGAEVVVVGRSPVVGKPVAMLLVREHSTVTMCHTRTVDLAAHTLRADILIAAAGSPRCITGDMIKPGAVVIDAGINVVEGGIVGDVAFDEAVEVARSITPVPGGVGPLTNVLLLQSVVENAEGRSGFTG